MAQIEFTEAEFIINETNNIHFITSHADNEREEQMKKKPGRGQMGWINLFDKKNNFQKKWLDLMKKSDSSILIELKNAGVKRAGEWLVPVLCGAAHHHAGERCGVQLRVPARPEDCQPDL